MQKDNTKKEALKKNILSSMGKFININFDDFFKNAKTPSGSPLDEEDAHKAFDHILETFKKIKNNHSTLDAFTSLELVKIKKAMMLLNRYAKPKNESINNR